MPQLTLLFFPVCVSALFKRRHPWCTETSYNHILESFLCDSYLSPVLVTKDPALFGTSGSLFLFFSRVSYFHVGESLYLKNVISPIHCRLLHTWLTHINSGTLGEDMHRL